LPKLSDLAQGGVAVVTGAASGIGLAAAQRFASLGFKVALVDLAGPQLEQAAKSVGVASPFGTSFVSAHRYDVSQLSEVQKLKQAVTTQFGNVTVLMNNAGIQPGSSVLSAANWQKVLDVNLMGIVHGVQSFVPSMIAHGLPGLIINTGSKQGITTPPGDPAYNVAKAGVKVFTEALQHELRNTPGNALYAHLLIPGFVYTPLTASGRKTKPVSAWTPEQTVEFMSASVDAGDFYILCPDHDVPRALDEKRIAWAAGDIIENRPPLSRWHEDYEKPFAEFLENSLLN
jgi:NAD(P)-dependent dehydrogenase (short-subunit alcohol dehydrogenase family)